MEVTKAEIDAVLDAQGRFVWTPNALTLDGQCNVPADLQPGESLDAFLRRHVPGIDSGAWSVSIGGAMVPRAMWAQTYPKHGMHIACRATVGKQAVQLVAIAALAYFSGGLAAGLYGAMGGTYVAANAGLVLSALQMGIFVAGSVLINKVLGPKVPKAGDAPAARQVYSLSGQRNSARAYESLPTLWGEMRVTPDLAAQSYAWFEGDEQYLAVRLLGGVNVHSAAGLSIGDTPLTDFHSVETYITGLPGHPNQEIPLAGNVDAVAGGELPDDPNTPVMRTGSVDAVALAVDLEYMVFHQGHNGVEPASVQVTVEYAPAGTGNWVLVRDELLHGDDTSPRRVSWQFDVPAGQYDVRVQRSPKGEDDKTTRQVTWTSLRSIQPDTTDYSQWGCIGIKIKATGQISGGLDTVRATYRAKPMPIWTGSAWATATTRETGLSNPGAILLQTLRGIKHNGVLQFGFGLSDDQIDIEGLKAFMLHCTANGYTYDRWLTSGISLQEFCQEVALAGMGEFSWTDGSRPTAVFVSDGQPVSAVVNMANMLKASFSVDYALSNAADGIEYSYVDRDKGFETMTLRVTAPGVTTMLNPARVTGEGVTTEAHAARMARYHLAQSLYQYKTIGYTADIEHLDYRRLSVLSVSHDLTQWGFGGRVLRAWRESGQLHIQLDESVPPLTTPHLGLRLPGDRDYRVFPVHALAGTSDVLVINASWPVGVALPGEGDSPMDTLWCYDFKATPGYRVRVTSLEPEGDLKGAKVTCVPEGPEFWNYVLTGEYQPAPNQSALPQLARAEVMNLRATEQVHPQGNTEWYELHLTWDVSGDVDHFQVWAAIDGVALRLVDANVRVTSASMRIESAGQWHVRVVPIDTAGRAGKAAELWHNTAVVGLPPSNPTSFAVHDLDGGLRRYVWHWEGSRPNNLAGVQIRHLPGDMPFGVEQWDAAEPLGDADDIYSAHFESVLPSAGVWTFGLRAINTSGILSPGVVRCMVSLSQALDDGSRPDMTPPPDVTGLKATAMFTAVLVEWDAVGYDQGHGHARTLIYAAQGEDATFADAVKVAEAYNGPVSFASEPDTVWKIWAKNQTVDGVESVYAAGPVQVRTAEDVEKVLDALHGKIAEDQLVQHLGERVDLIDGSGTGSVNARLADEAQIRAAAIANLAHDVGTSVQTLEDAITAGDAANASQIAQVIATNRSNPNMLPGFQAWEVGAGMVVMSAEWGGALYSYGDGAKVSRSPRVAVAGGVPYTLTSDSLRFAEAGAAYLDLQFFDAAGVLLLDSTQVDRQDAHDFRVDDVNRDANKLTVVSPPNAVSCSVRAVQDASGVIAIGWRQIKMERREVATRYSDEATSHYALALIASERAASVSRDAAEATARDTLSAQLRGSYEGNDLGAVTSGLIAQESRARVDGDAALSYQMSMLSAGVGEQFDSAKIWFFDTNGDAEGWVGQGAMLVHNGFMRLPDSAAPSNFWSAVGLGIDAAKYQQIKVRLRKTGSPVWLGRAWWMRTVDSVYDNTRVISIPEPEYDANGIALVTWMMPWDGVISAINFDLYVEQTAAGYVEIDWIAVGRPAPGASQASVQAEAAASASRDQALAQERAALAVSLTGVSDPSGKTIDQLTSGLLADERNARVAADAAEVAAREQLSASLQQAVQTVAADVVAERNARVAGDSATASSVTALAASIGSRPNLCPDVDKWTLATGFSVSTNGWGKIAASAGLANGTHVCSSPKMKCFAGAVYTISGDSMLLAASGNVYFDLLFFNNAGVVLLDGPQNAISGLHDFSNTDSQRKTHAIEAIAPSGAVEFLARYVVFNAQGVTAAGFRQVKVEQGGLPATQYSVEGDVSTLSASLQQEASIRADQTGTLFGRYSVKIDLNGYMTGYGLLSESNHGANTSTFAVRADRFVIGAANASAVSPFVVEGGRVFMNAAVIKDATIKNAMIENGTIQSAKIAGIDAGKITSGYIGVGNFIASTGYEGGLRGWAIWGNGNAEFNSITVRGTVYATSGQIAQWRINWDQLLSGSFTGYAWPTSGNGVCIAHAGIMIGNLNAGQYLHLTREGNLYAPGLRIEGGNAWFSGRMTAQAVNAVDTINLAGNAVTVPLAATGGVFAGNGAWNWHTINYGSIYMSQAGYVTGLLVAIQNHINNSNSWRMKLEIWQGGSMAGSVEIGGDALTVSPTITLTRPVSAGVVEVLVRWWGGNANCRIESSELLILGTKR